MSEIIARAKGDVVPWKSDTWPGLRANWLNCLLAIVLAFASAAGHSLFTGWSLLGLVILAVGFGIALLALRTKNTALGIAVGVILMAVFYSLVTLTHIRWADAFFGSVVAACIVGITLTRWWRHVVPESEDNNQGESEDNHQSVSKIME